jgi:hypothetical protein
MVVRGLGLARTLQLTDGRVHNQGAELEIDKAYSPNRDGYYGCLYGS